MRPMLQLEDKFLSMSPLPSVSQASPSSPFANALSASADGVAASTGYKKFVAPGSVKPVLKCSFCNFNGYTEENCYKLIGYLPSWKKKELSGTTPGSAGQFRPLPKTNQVNAAVNSSPSGVSNDQTNQNAKSN